MKTVVGLMNNREEAQLVVQDLVNSGFQRDAISIMASDQDGLGYKEGLGQEDIGALTKMGVPEEDAHYYAEGVKRGGFLVTVSADDQNADTAADIMRRHGAVDIDKQAETWRQEGWTRFDETAPYAESSQQGSNEVPAAASRQFYEREAMTEANASAEFEERSNVQQKQELEQKEVPYAASSQEFYQRDTGLGESGSSQPEREAIPRAAGSGERMEDELESRSVMDDEELDRYFSNTYGSRREGFEAYRSAFHYAEVKSCEPQLCDKEWPEVEEVIHQDWERTHPGTWTEVKEAIHLGWDKRRHH